MAAAGRIGPYVRETPLDYSPALSQASGADVYLKLENLQPTGSFKVRGAVNKLLDLTPEQRGRGVVAASSGNHGAAAAYGAGQLCGQAQVFVPHHASPANVAKMRALGAQVALYGDDSGVTEVYARQVAAAQGQVYVSPYNDTAVVAGQGTIGVELARQVDRVDAVFVAVGGGGLIGGVAAYPKTVQPGVRVVGCQPQASCVMAASVRAGRVLDLPSAPTLSDGTAGGIEQDAITFDLCRDLVDEYVLVGEDEIAAGVRTVIETHGQLVEGAAGVAVAAFLARVADYQGQRVVIIVCGGNISVETLRSVVC